MMKMKKQNYVAISSLAVLLVGVLVTAGCVQPPGPTNGGATVTPSGEGLPLLDQATGKEPFSRYPGSVMISHLMMDFTDEETGYMIAYGTAADASTVADWYRTQLESGGWDKEIEMQAEGSTNLVYTKGKESISIGITPEEYTNIAIMYSIEV